MPHLPRQINGAAGVIAATSCLFVLSGCPPTDMAPAQRFVPASELPLVYPTRIAVSGGGRVFISDPKQQRVFSFASGLRARELIGVDAPLGLAVAGDRLYVGDSTRGTVEVFSIKEEQLLFALGQGEGEFYKPNDIAVSVDGQQIFVADSEANRVRVYGADGQHLFDLTAAENAKDVLSFPVALAVNDAVLAVADQGHHRILIYDLQGHWLRRFGRATATNVLSIDDLRGHFSRLQSLAFAGDRLLVLDAYHGWAQVFDVEGHHLGFVVKRGEGRDQVDIPLDLAALDATHILVTDPQRHRWIRLPLFVRERP